MEQYKQEFIEFMVDSNVLRFGDFTLKSGRKSFRLHITKSKICHQNLFLNMLIRM